MGVETIVVATVLAVSTAASVYVAVEAKKQAKRAADSFKRTKDRTTQKQMFKNAVAPKQIVLGHPVLSGPMVFGCEEGDPNDEGDGEWLHIVVHLAGHPCDDVTHAWLDDTVLIRKPLTASGADVEFLHPNTLGYVYIYLGDHTETPPTLAHLPDWKANMVGRGQCFAHIKMKSDPDKWSGGIPNPKFAVRGAKVFDPRSGKTSWTDNPSLLVRWFRNELKQGVAMDDTYIAAANICDELVETPEGQEKRYRCNYSFMADQAPRSVLGAIRATCDGISLRVAGRHAFQVGAYYGPGVTTIGEDDIIGDIHTLPDVRRRDRINTVSAKYTDPDSNWNQVDMPRVIHDGYLEQDGYPVIDDLDFTAVPSAYQAQRLSMMHILTTRDSMSVEFTSNLRGARLLPGTVFKLNLPENQWHGVEFIVTKWKYASEGKVALVAKQTKAQHYEFNGDTAQVPTRPGAPNLISRDVLPVTHLAYTTLADSNTLQAVITWQHLSYGGTSFELSFFKNGTLLRKELVHEKQYRLQDGFTVGQYEVQVVAISYERRSPIASLVFNASAPQTPIGCDIQQGNWALQLSPISGGVVNFDTMYDFAFGYDEFTPNSELDEYIFGRAKVMTVGNLKADTTYQIAVREVSRWGQSAWYRTSAKTTFSGDDVLDIIEGGVTKEILDQDLQGFLDQLDLKAEESSSAVADVKEGLDGVSSELINLGRQAKDTEKELFSLTHQVSSFTTEYEKRILEEETLIDAVVSRDPETGEIVNKAFAFSEAKYTQAGILIDGLNAKVEIGAKEIQRVESEAGKRLSEAEAAITVSAGKIDLKASYSEVSEIVSGALDALTPAYSWQFNTGTDGWEGATWNNLSAISGTGFSRSNITFVANDNPIVRLRVQAQENGYLSWNGGNQRVLIPHPGVQDAFETVVLNLTPDDGWDGDVTSLYIEMNATIDSIEIGKQSATELQLQEISYRTTQIEQELDAENARWGVYLTQDYWDTHALTLSDVSQEIDGWDAQWKVSATLQELDSNKTLYKANSAAQWISASEANITNVVVAFNAQPDGIDETLANNKSRLKTAEQQIDAVKGEIRQTVTSISSVENLLGNNESIDDLLDAYNTFIQQGEFAKQQVSLGYSQSKLESHSDELSSQAQFALDLLATQGEQEAAIKRTERAIADSQSALSETKEQLEAKVDRGDSEVYSRATQYTKVAVGYCVDALGRVTEHDDAVACVSAGHSWVDGPLAEFVRNLQIKNAKGQQASIAQMMQTFEKADGGLVVRGGMISDNNGKISGFVNTNDGTTSSMDFIQDHFRVGYQDDNGNFVPIQYIDTESGKMVFKGRLILDDGELISNVEQLKGQDGIDGDPGDNGSPGNVWGTLVLRDGVFPTDSTATNDFRTRYNREPVLDDMLTYVSNDGSASSVKTFDGTKWVAPGLRLNGNLITKGSIYGDRFVAGSEIRSPVFSGGSGYFSDVVRIGEVNGYSVFINGAAAKGTDKVLRAGTGSKATFYLNANGYLHSEAGGYLNNLTIGSNCQVLGKISASQVEGTKLPIASGSVSIAGAGDKYGSASKTGDVDTNFQAAAWGDPRKTYVVELSISGAMEMDPFATDPNACYWEYEVTGQRTRVYWSAKPATLWFSWKMFFNRVKGAQNASLDWVLYQII